MAEKETTDVNTEVEDKLAKAAAEESSTTEKVETKTTEEATKTEEKGENQIPQSRFNEVNSFSAMMSAFWTNCSACNVSRWSAISSRVCSSSL